jgi:hypothetical protein
MRKSSAPSRRTPRIREPVFGRLADPAPAVIQWLKILCADRLTEAQRKPALDAFRRVLANWQRDWKGLYLANLDAMASESRYAAASKRALKILDNR